MVIREGGMMGLGLGIIAETAGLFNAVYLRAQTSKYPFHNSSLSFEAP